MKNPTLVFFDDAYGYNASATREAGRDLTEKEMRKWWKHYAKRAPECIAISATYENDEGEIRDITENWVMHECAMYADAHSNIFN